MHPRIPNAGIPKASVANMGIHSCRRHKIVAVVVGCGKVCRESKVAQAASSFHQSVENPLGFGHQTTK
jgi:hypothetical protein